MKFSSLFYCLFFTACFEICSLMHVAVILIVIGEFRCRRGNDV